MERRLLQRGALNGERLDAIDQRISEVQANSAVTVQRLESKEAPHSFSKRKLTIPVADSRMLLDVHGDTKEIKCRVTDVQATVGDTHAMIVHYEEITQSFAPDILPETTLKTMSSIARRAGSTHGQARDKFNLVRRLRDWASSVVQPIMVVHTGPRAQNQAVEWAISAFGSLPLEAGSRIYWYLQTCSSRKRPFDRVALLENLTFQLLRSAKEDGSAMAVDVSALDNLKTSSSEAELLQGLGTVARHRPRCFFIIEADSFVEAAPDQQTPERENSSMGFFEGFVEIGRSSGCDMKIVVISPCEKLAAAAQESDHRVLVEVQWSAPPPPHSKRLAMRTRVTKSYRH